MKYLELDKPVLVGKKYARGLRVYEAIYVAETGVLVKVIKEDSMGAKEGTEIFYRNNDRDFWADVTEYVPPPIKKKVFVIVWLHSERVQCITDQDDFSAHSWIKLGWTPVKGFEVEYYVPQVSD